jgi:hypothetical protein
VHRSNGRTPSIRSTLANGHEFVNLFGVQTSTAQQRVSDQADALLCPSGRDQTTSGVTVAVEFDPDAQRAAPLHQVLTRRAQIACAAVVGAAEQAFGFAAAQQERDTDFGFQSRADTGSQNSPRRSR